MIPVNEAAEMHRLIQGAELAVLPNSDHSLPLTRAELFRTTVMDFLVRHKAQTEKE
jgi:pimeloyl-ACP methyl ester carboxylesterase